MSTKTTSDSNSYKQIVKSTTLMGSVQIFNIIISIIRTKFVSMYLGPSGMGIFSLLTASIGLISGITSFGLGTSAVRNVAEANSTGNIYRISRVVTVVKRWLWITGLFGSILTVALSSRLSQITFGNKEFTYAFIYLSITLLFNQLAGGQLVILQGLQKLKHIAKANLLGGTLGTLIAVPLYYLYGKDAIVVTIIITSLITLSFTWYFSSKIKILPIKTSLIRTYAEGKNMLSMGFIISFTATLSVISAYLVKIFIGKNGGIDDVGFYNAGFAIVYTYSGIVLTAIAYDYYPRLSAVAKDNNLSGKMINEQAEMAVLILSPIIVIFLVFMNWIILLLYTREFIVINSMINWAILAIPFRALGWAVGFIFYAKGEAKLLLINELCFNVYSLLLNVIFYYYLGLTGLGISFLIAYFLYLLQVIIVTKIKHNFFFNKGIYRIFTVQLILIVISYLVCTNFVSLSRYLIGTMLIIISTFYSFIEINKRVDLKNYIRLKLKK